MAAISDKEIMPKKKISPFAIPKAVREAIIHIFKNCGKEGVWLVGGTALAGFYAGHRRSDDIDLFASDENFHRAAVLAVKSLQKLGAVFSREMQTPQFFRTDVSWQNYRFTIDVVLDENIHRIGHAFRSDEGILFSDLTTLFAMKAACLVSRASEKDLFDLDWIFSHAPEKADIPEIVSQGSKIDSGLTVETLLLSLKGTMLRKEACHFLLPGSKITPDEAYKKVLATQKKLIHSLLEYEKNTPLSEDESKLARAVKDIRRFK